MADAAAGTRPEPPPAAAAAAHHPAAAAAPPLRRGRPARPQPRRRQRRRRQQQHALPSTLPYDPPPRALRQMTAAQPARPPPRARCSNPSSAADICGMLRAVCGEDAATWAHVWWLLPLTVPCRARRSQQWLPCCRSAVPASPRSSSQARHECPWR